MKNRINLLITLFLSVSCTISNVSNNSNISLPSISSSTYSPKPIPTVSISLTPTIISTSMPTSLINNEDNFRIIFEGDGYIYTPETSFFTLNPLDISLSLYLKELPETLYSIFEIYDTENKNVYLSLSLDKDKNFIINFLGNEEKTKLDNFSLNEKIDIRLLKDNNKLKFTVNNTVLINKEFSITDNKNKKIIFIGSNNKEENKIKGEYGFFIVKDIIIYNFKKNLLDEGIYGLHALSKGNYKLTNLETPTTTTPNVEITPTPTLSSTPIHERNDVQTIKFSKQTIDLSVDISAASQGNRLFYTKWYDLEKRKFLDNNEIGDIRFYTLIQNSGNKKVFLQGRLENPATYIIDLGKVKFEGVTDINNLDFQKEQLINKDKDKAELYNDHTYAIQTFRYGKPRYAKLFVNHIITQNFDYSKMKKPEITSQPIFVDAGEQTFFENNTVYKYYVSCYDGYGETEVVSTNSISNSDTTNKKVSFSFILPYRAKGYYIYKEFGGKIYKSGPFYGEAEKNNTYEDTGNFGKQVTSLPTENTTIFSSYKEISEIPIKLEFTYSFNGEPDLKTFFFE
jgi:hypothetical protein